MCPGEIMNVDDKVEIVAGFDDNSKHDNPQMPRWKQSFNIAPKSIIDMRGPGFSPPMQTAYWGTDNCLYGNPSKYPLMAPPAFTTPNKEYQSKFGSCNNSPLVQTCWWLSSVEMGCASKTYDGPALENPWTTMNYGTAAPAESEPSLSDDSLLDQLRFYRDYEPLYRNLYDKDQKKSDSDISPSDITASTPDSSWFSADSPGSYSFSLGGAGTDSTVSTVSTGPNSVDTTLLGISDSGASDPTDYTAFLPSLPRLPSSGESKPSDITWDSNPDLTTNNLLANLDSGIDSWLTTDSPTIDYSSSLNLGDYVFSNSENLFTKRRTRRSARDFSLTWLLMQLLRELKHILRHLNRNPLFLGRTMNGGGKGGLFRLWRRVITTERNKSLALGMNFLRTLRALNPITNVYNDMKRLNISPFWSITLVEIYSSSFSHSCPLSPHPHALNSPLIIQLQIPPSIHFHSESTYHMTSRHIFPSLSFPSLPSPLLSLPLISSLLHLFFISSPFLSLLSSSAPSPSL